MKALVTGHMGFIGRHLTERLKSLGNEVIGLDILHADDVRFVELPDVDVVFHLAGFAGVRSSVERPEEYWDNNVLGAQRVFDHYSAKGVEIYYASSSSAKRWWLNPYATTKKVLEQIAPANSCGMRFHTVYGFDSRPDMLYDKLLRRSVVHITNHVRDFTHVDDVVEAIMCLYVNKVRGVVDVGTSMPVSVVELAQAAGVVMTPGAGMSTEQEETCADPIELFDLGWRPTKNVLEEVKNDIIRKAEMEEHTQYGQCVH
jgi:nucleoside-diphosphate-sugar epimerase